MKILLSVAVLTVAALSLPGCDMRHAVRLELKEGAVADNRLTVSDVMATLKPVIAKNDLQCAEKPGQQRLEIQCKTWSLSSSSLHIIDTHGVAQVIVEDESPIFFWTPQPYGRIRKDVINALKNRYGEDRLDCGQGFGLGIPCNEWPKENKPGK
jgi:hypothetical protein